MKKFIVITTINYPTEAVKLISNLPDNKLIVVGDMKTPGDWYCENSIFIPVENKFISRYSINKALPYNHYCRKMLGYLYAMDEGAEAIIDTDDDNIPKHRNGFPALEGIYDCVMENKGFINVYKYFTDQFIWPRGLPLRLINDKNFFDNNSIIKKYVKIGIWQGLADEDPDVDAIYRLIFDKPCFFKERNPLVLLKHTISPFNSQNTMFRRELFPLLYLPTTVTFRFTDILRSLVAQPIMWLYGYNLGFVSATVVQKRNPHDYHLDFISEIPMYIYTEKVIEIVKDFISGNKSIIDNLYNVYLELKNKGIVKSEEMHTLECWIKDIDNYKT